MALMLEQIQQASTLLKKYLQPTPTVLSPWLSQELKAQVFLKLEILQPTGSFKVRGACAAIQSLGEEQARQGIITMSSGNHAQAVAYFARLRHIPATIVMPKFTPLIKVQRTQALGATAILQGDTLDDAQDFAYAKAKEQGFTLIHPYDDERVIAGQGTTGLELHQTAPDLDAVIIPIGGGGLIAGIATALKALKPSIHIYGVQSALYPTMKQALTGKPVRCGGATLADGMGVKRPGTLTLPIIRNLVDEIFLVEEEEIEMAVNRLSTEQKIVAEGAGATGVAALLQQSKHFKDKRVATVICGGNIDSRLMSSILLRGLAREGRLVRLRITINDVPGVLARTSQIVAASGGQIIEVYHHRLSPHITIKGATLDMVVEIQDHAHAESILSNLRQEGFAADIVKDID